jgi:hypothetical protein
MEQAQPAPLMIGDSSSLSDTIIDTIKSNNNAGDDDSCKSYSSITMDHGVWEGDDEVHAWKGCLCGTIHARPTPVRWIQCDGACQSWYNCSEQCLVGQQQQEEEHFWYCPDCVAAHSQLSQGLQLFLSLPDTLLYRILTLCAAPRERVNYLLLQLSPLCKILHHSIQFEKVGVWDRIMEEYAPTVEADSTIKPPPAVTLKRKRATRRTQQQQEQQQTISQSHYDLSTRLIHRVRNAHEDLLHATDDAHVALSAMCDNQHSPLTLKRLRRILGPHRILANRRSCDSGRTFVMTVCAADYVDEGVILRCVKELVEKHGACTRMWSSQEAPFANRTALFFAAARVMPTVVKYLIEHEHHQLQWTRQEHQSPLQKRATGRFKLVTDPTQSFCGSFTPLEYMKRLQSSEEDTQRQRIQRDIQRKVPSSNNEEHQSQQQDSLPNYWKLKLKACIKILAKFSCVQAD